MAAAWFGVVWSKRSRSRARNSGSASPSVVKVVDDTIKFCSSARCRGFMPAEKASALVFAYPRDNGANALLLSFREGTPSQFGRNANHAFTEWRSYSAPHRVSARYIGEAGDNRVECVKISRRRGSRCHCERSEAISGELGATMGIAASLRSSQ